MSARCTSQYTGGSLRGRLMAKDPARPADESTAESEDLDVERAEAASVRFRPSWASSLGDTGTVDEQGGSPAPQAHGPNPRAVAAPSGTADYASGEPSGSPNPQAPPSGYREQMKTPPGGIAVESSPGEVKLGVTPAAAPAAVVRAPSQSPTSADRQRDAGTPAHARALEVAPERSGDESETSLVKRKELPRRQRVATQLGLMPPSRGKEPSPEAPEEHEAKPREHEAQPHERPNRVDADTEPDQQSAAADVAVEDDLSAGVSPGISRGKVLVLVAIGAALAIAAALLALGEAGDEGAPAPESQQPDVPAASSTTNLEPADSTQREQSEGQELPQAAAGQTTAEAESRKAGSPAPKTGPSPATGKPLKLVRPPSAPSRPATPNPADGVRKATPRPPTGAPVNRSTDIVRKAPF